MNKNKICNLNLIENTKKKKIVKRNINDLKDKLNNIIDVIIDCNVNFNSKIKNHELKNLLIKFIEIYININRHIKLQNYKINEKNIINDLINDLVDNVIYRCCNNKELDKEITLIDNYKKNYNLKIDKITLIKN